MFSSSSSTSTTADSALAMARSPMWSRASRVAAGCCSSPPPPDPVGRVMQALGPTGGQCPRRELRVVRSQRRSDRRVSGAPSRTPYQSSSTPYSSR